jgi:hypothetical protein
LHGLALAKHKLIIVLHDREPGVAKHDLKLLEAANLSDSASQIPFSG